MRESLELRMLNEVIAKPQNIPLQYTSVISLDFRWTQ